MILSMWDAMWFFRTFDVKCILPKCIDLIESFHINAVMTDSANR